MPEHAELDVDELMREIRDELAERNGGPGGPPGVGAGIRVEARSDASSAPGFRLSRLSESSGIILRHSHYDLNTLLAYHDEDFMRNAYLALLGREPDSEGASRYLAKLRNGELAKVEVLGRIRFSPEGRLAGVKVAGLVVPFGLRTLRRIPVIGYVVGIVQYVVRLPTVVRNLERLEAVVFLHRLELRRAVNSVETEIEGAMQGTYADLSHRIESESAQAEQRLGERVELLASRIAEIDDLASRLQSQRAAQDERWNARLGAIDRDKADRGALDELARRQESVSGNQRELGEALARLRELVDVAQASVKDLEQGKADHAQLDASIGRVAAEILELRSVAKEGAAELGDLRGDIGRAAAELEEVRSAIGMVENRMAGRTSAPARAESLAIAQSAPTTAQQTDTERGSIRERLAWYQQKIIDQERRLSTLLDVVHRRLPEQAFGPDQLATFGQEQEHVLDGFYLEFEDRFRGTREDIMQRVGVYLPYIRNANAGTPNAPVLDIGCGRGEWLELLAGQGLVGQGVDSNRFAAAFCRERGIAVAEADAVDYLRSLQTGSLGAITAIHVIEHMPFVRMIALFDEARRVLRTGGVAIFETPNPENVVVGACNFYYDPTHVRPLPPEPMRFVVSHRGFEDVELLRLHPRHDAPVPDVHARPLDREVEQRFFGEQDYAVVGYKRETA
jgi:SAM-dependent methyltransferase